MCEGPDFTELYVDGFDARIAAEAHRLEELVTQARRAGRLVPASVDRASDDLWRWAGKELTPRGRAVLGPSRYDLPLPGITVEL
jgi:hypothetical protein